MSLLVPVALWPQLPPHEVTVVHVHASGTTTTPVYVITGARNGHLCIWAPQGEGIQPRAVLLGHDAAIVAIASVIYDRSDAVVAISEDAMLTQWDPMDSRCLFSRPAPTALAGRTTCLAVLPDKRHVAHGGHYDRIFIVELISLSTVIELAVSTMDGALALSAVDAQFECDVEGEVREQVDSSRVACVDFSGVVRVWTVVKDEGATPTAEPTWRVAQENALGDVAGTHGGVGGDAGAPVAEGAASRGLVSAAFSVDQRLVAAVTATSCAIAWTRDPSNVLCVIHSAGVHVPAPWCGLRLHVAGLSSAAAVAWAADGTVVVRSLDEELAGARTAGTGDGDDAESATRSTSSIVARGSEGGRRTAACLYLTGVDDRPSWAVVTGDVDGVIWRCPWRVGEDETATASRWGALEDGWKVDAAAQDPLDRAEDVAQSPAAPRRRVTALVVVMVDRGATALLVTGCADGALCASVLPGDELVQAPLRVHTAAVTALLSWPSPVLGAEVTDPSDRPRSAAVAPVYVVSGGDDGAVVVCRVRPLEPLCRFDAHVGRVCRLLRCPDQLQGGSTAGPSALTASTVSLAGGFASSGADGAVCIFAPSGDLVRLRLVLSGHLGQPEELLWLPELEYICVRTARGAHVWHAAAGRLERVVTAEEATEMVAAWAKDRAPTSAVHVQRLRTPLAEELGGTHALTGALETVGLSTEGSTPSAHGLPCAMLIIVLSVRRLAAAINNVAAAAAAAADLHYRSGHGAGAGEGAQAAAGAHGGLEISLCRLALSYLLPWHADSVFDRACEDEVQLTQPGLGLSYGVRGHAGLLSLLTPASSHGAGRWRCSSHLTALHSLAAVTLCNTLMSHPGNDRFRNFCSLLAAHFSVRLPSSLPGFCPPSLTLLARTFVDPVDAVQQAARVLMDGTLKRMPTVTQQQLLNAWTPRVLRLGTTAPGDGGSRGAGAAVPGHLEIHSPAGIAVLVVTLLACNYGHELSTEVTEVLADIWLQMLQAPHATHRRLAGEMIGAGFTLWQPVLRCSVSRLIKQLFQLMAVTAGLHGVGSRGGGIAPPTDGQGQGPGPYGSGPGRHTAFLDRLGLGGNSFLGALVRVGTAQPALFAQLMGDIAVQIDIDSARRYAAAPAPSPTVAVAPCLPLTRRALRAFAPARSAAIVTLVSLVRSQSQLERELPTIVEAILRPLDPSVPSLREGCLQVGHAVFPVPPGAWMRARAHTPACARCRRRAPWRSGSSSSATP